MYALCVSGAVNTQSFVWKFFMRYIYKFSFIHSHITLKVDAIRAENTLFAGTSVRLSARKFYRLGQRRG